MAKELLGSFQEFLIVLIHSILYSRKLYSLASFIAVVQYGIKVHQNRHPELCQWIESMASHCIDMISTGSITKLSVVIMQGDEANTPLERFVLDLRRIARDDVSSMPPSTEPDMIWSVLAENYRACILRLLNISGTLGPVPETATFTILLESDEPSTFFEDEQLSSLWTIADPDEYRQNPESLERTSPVRLRPIQNVTTEDLAFRFWLEESKSNEKARAKSKGKTKATTDDWI